MYSVSVSASFACRPTVIWSGSPYYIRVIYIDLNKQHHSKKSNYLHLLQRNIGVLSSLSSLVLFLLNFYGQNIFFILLSLHYHINKHACQFRVFALMYLLHVHVHRVGQKSKPNYFCNNFVSCLLPANLHNFDTYIL